MIENDGWKKYSIWEHSSCTRELYERRCRQEAEEMTCSAQAAEVLSHYAQAGDSLLDVGCGSGYFYHSLKKKSLSLEYYGMDACAAFIELGKKYLPSFGLDPERLIQMRLEDLSAEVDHVVCINVLSNLDHYPRYLERLLHAAQKSLVLRESLSETASCLYVEDKYLDAPSPLKVPVNTYSLDEVKSFIKSYGFEVEEVVDKRTNGQPEMVIDYPHHWKFLVAKRIA